MLHYPIPLVPGPVVVSPATLAAYGQNYGSPDLEEEFLTSYKETAHLLQQIMGTESDVIIALGEAMVVLWGTIKSALGPGTRHLAISSGIFGAGFAEMAQVTGAESRLLDLPWDEVPDPEQVVAAVRDYQPHVVTMVHCETPSGTLTPVEAVGQRLREVAPDTLFIVDAVASIGGAPLNVDAAQIDFCLLGSQKCLSAVPDLGIVSVSTRGWARINELGYQGYDALAPYQQATKRPGNFPYTHSWYAINGLNVACHALLQEGLAASHARHARVARQWRNLVHDLGLSLYPKDEATCAPTVTAVEIPDYLNWPTLNARLRAQGMVVGGNYGKLAGKVFRIGHMGNQATDDLFEHGGEVLREALRH